MEGTRKPDFSNVQSGGSSTAPQSSEAVPKIETYTVQAGDSLSKIAKRIYGDVNAWKKLFDANRDQIDDADLIHPGQILKVPPR